jgi:SAM-dependent methyltransferase
MLSLMPSPETIKSFWDQAAEADPYWYVSSYGQWGAKRNLDEFWASGRSIWTDLKRATGYKPTPSDTVVEIGCGVGRLTRVIAPEVGSVISLDISEKMLVIARQANLPNVEFRQAQGFALPGIPDKSVSLALGYCVFQHLPSHAALKSYIDEMYRVTMPGGTIAFTFSSRDWTAWLMPLLRARAYLREHLLWNRSPKGLYRKEWVGIRPSHSAVLRLSPIRLDRRDLGAGRILYFGTH